MKTAGVCAVLSVACFSLAALVVLLKKEAAKPHVGTAQANFGDAQGAFASGPAVPAGALDLVSPGRAGAQAPAILVGVVTPGPPQPAAAGQRLKRFVAGSGGKVRIEGTSNIHDWQVEGALTGGELEAGPGFPADGEASGAARAEAFIAVRSLKSLQKDGRPHSDRMDEVMYDCLKARTHGRIFYSLLSLVPKSLTTTDGAFTFYAVGTLAVGGVTNTVEMPVAVTPLPDSRLKIRGTTAVKMTSFGIEPPSPKWLGSVIKTGDEVKLFVEWIVAEKVEFVASAN